MEEVYSTGTLSLAVVCILICALGVFLHSFIAIVNVIDWFKGSVLTSTDHILTCLGVTRIFFQFSAICYMMLTFFFPKSSFKEPLLFVVDLSEVFFTYLSFWLTTLLSVVFCLKICNLKSSIFLLLKGFILPKVVHLIFWSVFVSICYTALCIWIGNFEIPRQLEHAKISNGTLESTWKYALIFVLGSSAPFLIYFIAAILLVSSLCLHMSQMRGHSHGITRLETFRTAIQFVTICSLYYLIHAGGIEVAFYLYYIQSVEVLGIYAITDSLPVFHSIYLIFKTAKLRSRLTGIVQHGTGNFPIKKC